MAGRAVAVTDPRGRRIDWAAMSVTQGELLDAFAVYCRDELDDVELVAESSTRLELAWRRAPPRRRRRARADRRLRPGAPREGERSSIERVRLLRVVPARRVRGQGRRLRRVHPRARRPGHHLPRVRIVDAVRRACLSRPVTPRREFL